MDEEVEHFLDDEYADDLSDVPSDAEDSDTDYYLYDSDMDDPDDCIVASDGLPNNLEVSDQNIECDWLNIDPSRENETFEGSSGPTVSKESFVGRNKIKAKDVVAMFIGDDLLEYIVVETNKYYAQNSQNMQKFGEWTELTVVELKKWLGLMVLMGIIRKFDVNDYWTTDPLFETPIFEKTMKRDRFRQILACLHFSDNKRMPLNADRLFKIQYLVDYFTQKFKDNFKPGQNISIDEDVIRWREKMNIRIYRNTKVDKYGITVKALCDSTSGYISNFSLHCGPEPKLEKTIMDLSTHCSEKWHHLYLNNLYNSVHLANKLLSKKIRVCGTIKSNRELPQVLRKSKLKRLESTFVRRGEVLLQLWKISRRKHVGIISTIHNAEVVNVSNNEYWAGQVEHIQRPLSVVDYKQHTKGLDRANEFLIDHPTYRNTKKWSKRVAFYLINCGMFNAYRVYEQLNGITSRKFKYYEFLKLLVKAWLKDNAAPRNQRLI